MRALASFDRWIESRHWSTTPGTDPVDGKPSRPEDALPGTEWPQDDLALELSVRQRWQVSQADWLAVLVQERSHLAAGDQWGLALWRRGRAQPEWLSLCKTPVRGCPSPDLKRQLLRAALQAPVDTRERSTLH